MDTENEVGKFNGAGEVGIMESKRRNFPEGKKW